MLCLQAPAALMAKVIEVKPRAGAKLSAFGWCPDGNIANSAISFAMTSLVAFAVVHNHVLPPPLINALAHIDAVYKKHDNNQARVLSNIVETQASRFVNRSGHGPFFPCQGIRKECNRTRTCESRREALSVENIGQPSARYAPKGSKMQYSDSWDQQ